MRIGSESHTSIARALLALALSAGFLSGIYCAASEQRAGGGATEADDESDSAAFTVVVEHSTGWVCSGALVSLRTALTSARCARGRGGGGEVWARAPPSAGSRVLRVAEAAGAGAEQHGAGAWWARADVALLELAEALAGSRAVLLAASRADCEPPAAAAVCHLVRALGSGGARTRLRIVELTLQPASACWPRPPPAEPLLPPAPSGLRPLAALGDERGLCFAGPDLCQSDQGAGIVCGGKLCGVLSGSRHVQSRPEPGPGQGTARCGAPHGAASAPRWRRFLHCAHTRGACGRDGECARLCTERWLVDELASPSAPASLSAAPSASSSTLDPSHETPDRTILTEAAGSIARSHSTQPTPTRSPAPPPRPPPPPLPRPLPRGSELQLQARETTPASSSSMRLALEFEPNRADFTAGEYGDNAAEYVAPPGDEPPPSVASGVSVASGASVASGVSAARGAATRHDAPVLARIAPAPAPAPAGARASPVPRPRLLSTLLYLSFLF